MKRFYIVFLTIIISLTINATQIDSTNAVTMVSYEQSYSDVVGTISLKNNTNNDIHNVKFQITYLDMSGKPLDYKDFYETVDIAPGKTKKIDITAYEQNRDYSYYKSEAEYIHPHKFKIAFELIGYNLEDQQDSQDSKEGIYILSSLFIFIIVCLGVYIGLYVLVAVISQRNKRNVVIWLLLSLVLSPLLTLIILLFIGKDNNSNTL